MNEKPRSFMSSDVSSPLLGTAEQGNPVARKEPKQPTFELEAQLGGDLIAGVDEAGRGPWAGPVCAAAVILKPDFLTHPLCQKINDSKRISPSNRYLIVEELKALGENSTDFLIFGVGQASPQEIDQTNILQATFLAAKRALEALPMTPKAILFDGNMRFPSTIPLTNVIRGDQKSLSIAAASLVAKVTRDTYMAELAQQYPDFGWERNQGYGTAHHRQALVRLGPTPHHRLSFKPVAEVVKAQHEQKQAG